MGVFLLFLILAIALLLIKIEMKVTSVKKRPGFFTLEIYFLFVKIFHTVIYVHFRHYVCLEIIKVKKYGFNKLYSLYFKLDERAVAAIRLLKAGDVRKMDFQIRVGTGDAATTAILCGLLGTFIDSLLKVVGLTAAKSRVHPDFKNTSFEIFLIGILRLSFADIIVRFLKEKRRKYASN